MERSGVSVQQCVRYCVLLCFIVGILVACGTVAPTPVMVPTVAPGPVKIVTLGDSQTAGYGDERVGKPEAGGYPAMMIVPVISLRPDSRVKNLGQGSWTSTDLVNGTKDTPSQLQSALAEHPKIICIWIGMNDLLYFNTPDKEAPALKAYENNIDTILRSLSGHGATLAIALLDDPSKRPGIADGSYAVFYDWYRQSNDHQV